MPVILNNICCLCGGEVDVPSCNYRLPRLLQCTLEHLTLDEGGSFFDLSFPMRYTATFNGGLPGSPGGWESNHFPLVDDLYIGESMYGMDEADVYLNAQIDEVSAALNEEGACPVLCCCNISWGAAYTFRERTGGDQTGAIIASSVPVLSATYSPIQSCTTGAWTHSAFTQTSVTGGITLFDWMLEGIYRWQYPDIGATTGDPVTSGYFITVE